MLPPNSFILIPKLAAIAMIDIVMIYGGLICLITLCFITLCFITVPNDTLTDDVESMLSASREGDIRLATSIQKILSYG